jgi:hypothetical protein
MNKRIKVRSSTDNTVKSISKPENIITAVDIINAFSDTMLGGIPVGTGLTLVGDSLSIEAWPCYASVAAAPQAMKAYVEREVYDVLSSQFRTMQNEFWMLRDRVLKLECDKFSGDSSSSNMSQRLQKIENDFLAYNLPDLQGQVMDLHRKVEWDQNSIMNQLKEVRGAEYRYIF